MNRNIPLSLLLCLSSTAFAGTESTQNLPSTQRLYTDLVYELIDGGAWTTKPTVKVTIAGTFWALTLNDQPVLITAAHTVGVGPNSTPSILYSKATNGTKYVIGKKTKLNSISGNTVLGTLALEVESAGVLDKSVDVILLKPKDEAVYKSSRLVILGSGTATIGDRVKVCGFSGTAHEQPEFASIADIRPAQNFLILDKQLDGGCSGGVVLNEKNEAIGIVTGTEAKQATAILLTPALLSKVEWKPFKEVQTRTIGPE